MINAGWRLWSSFDQELYSMPDEELDPRRFLKQTNRLSFFFSYSKIDDRISKDPDIVIEGIAG